MVTKMTVFEYVSQCAVKQCCQMSRLYTISDSWKNKRVALVEW